MLPSMELQLSQQSFDLLANASHFPSIHFHKPEEAKKVLEELQGQDIAIFEIDGATIHSEKDLYKKVAIVFKMPEGWYGPLEKYATNPNAFLEYLEDVSEWVPAKNHAVFLYGATKLWKNHPQIAGW